jgi:hypothetical protein
MVKNAICLVPERLRCIRAGAGQNRKIGRMKDGLDRTARRLEPPE